MEQCITVRSNGTGSFFSYHTTALYTQIRFLNLNISLAMSRYIYVPLSRALLSLIICGLSFLPAVQTVHAQTKIGGTAGPGDASAVLELQSTANNQGFLHPRLSTAQRNAISNPATGLTIYNTDDNCVEVYKGAGNGGWFNLCSGGGSLAFTNCASPVINGSFTMAQAATATVTLNYNNGTGQDFGAFGSSTVNGITLSAPGGAVTPLASSGGSITLTASGTPTASGNINIPVVLAGTACSIPITVAGCSDPGSTPGNTGCVTFTYRGQQVTYTTVRAKDGKIWLQQNLGSSQVATSTVDPLAVGDDFQWGRWDDGHQLISSSTAAGPAPNNPSAIPSGSTNFYLSWWSGGTTSDVWSTTASPDATHGKDPCAALGSGWHVPTEAEWITVMSSANENLVAGPAASLNSNLKMLTNGTYRNYSNGQMVSVSGNAWYWASDPAASTGYGRYLNIYTNGAGMGQNQRGFGFSVRCVK